MNSRLHVRGGDVGVQQVGYLPPPVRTSRLAPPDGGASPILRDFAQCIEAQRTENEHARRRAARRARQFPDPFDWEPHHGGLGRDGPARGLLVTGDAYVACW